jgi:hypothetical protein
MSWIEDKYDRGTHSQEDQSSSPAPQPAEQKWSELLNGLEEDARDFSRLGGKANFEKVSDTECRITNPAANISAILTEDPSAQMIRYTYTPDVENVAVPEGGVLTLRVSGNGAQLYSAAAYAGAGSPPYSGAPVIPQPPVKPGSHRNVAAKNSEMCSG